MAGLIQAFELSALSRKHMYTTGSCQGAEIDRAGGGTETSFFRLVLKRLAGLAIERSEVSASGFAGV